MGELVHVFFTSIGSAVALFILTKFMGYKQMSQLTMFDYTVGITIGSIAAEMATALEDDFLKPLLAMVIYALIAILLSFVNYKSIKLRRWLTGRPLILFENGKLYKKNLKTANLDISEFLTQCRNEGYFNIANLQTAIMEPNGKISFLPLATHRPVTPCDLNLAPSAEKPIVNVIIDGNIQTQNLKHTGNNEEWLKKQLSAQGISKAEDVFLATCDCDNNLSIYIQIKDKMKRDIFE